ncbi:rRNA maturation RNase YbeY [soil metagenome]
MSISFFNADINYVLRDKTALKIWLNTAAKKEGFSIEDLNIILCSDEFLYRMNVAYLRHKTYTDIITFDNSVAHGAIVGELYISIDRVRDNSKILQTHLRDELHRVIVHGLLHLMGYSDKTDSLKRKMSLKEDQYLKIRKFL